MDINTDNNDMNIDVLQIENDVKLLSNKQNTTNIQTDEYNCTIENINSNISKLDRLKDHIHIQHDDFINNSLKHVRIITENEYMTNIKILESVDYSKMSLSNMIDTYYNTNQLILECRKYIESQKISIKIID